MLQRPSPLANLVDTVSSESIQNRNSLTSVLSAHLGGALSIKKERDREGEKCFYIFNLISNNDNRYYINCTSVASITLTVPVSQVLYCLYWCAIYVFEGKLLRIV